MYTEVAAIGCLVWYVFISLVCAIGTLQIFRHYSQQPPKPVSSNLENNAVPHVTVIRPCTGIEPYLSECLASIFQQDYPANKLTTYFCVPTVNDAAYPILQRLVQEYPNHDAKIYVEDQDEALYGENGRDIGPNPKIRNMSHAYRAAKGDIVWILDCNIWVNTGACGRMVDKLCGFTRTRNSPRRPYKLIAHLPVCISVDNLSLSSSTTKKKHARGGLLEQSFLSTAHAKMYVAINSVAVAPCINGKSTMFRRSHLNHLTQSPSGRAGIDYFGQNICEDHLIGDLLWKSSLPPRLCHDTDEETRKSNPAGLKFKNHGLAFNDAAVQPIASMSLSSYIARRVRWLRVRKFTVPVATLVEPGTESLMCSAMGAWGATTSKYTRDTFHNTWTATIALWLTSVVLWCLVDFSVFSILQGGGHIETPSYPPSNLQHKQANPKARYTLPPFVTPTSTPQSDSTNKHHPQHLRPITWLSAWLARETLAFPVWTWAIWGGTTVVWRNKKFWVGIDMKVHEIPTTVGAQVQEGTRRMGKEVNDVFENIPIVGDGMNGPVLRKR